MENKLDELMKGVTASLSGAGVNRYATAYCPICGDKQMSSTTGGDVGAQIVSIGKVKSHIKESHKGELAE